MQEPSDLVYYSRLKLLIDTVHEQMGCQAISEPSYDHKAEGIHLNV